MLKNFVPAGSIQWRPHKACTELAEVKTVAELGDLAVQINALEPQFEADVYQNLCNISSLMN